MGWVAGGSKHMSVPQGERLADVFRSCLKLVTPLETQVRRSPAQEIKMMMLVKIEGLSPTLCQ